MVVSLTEREKEILSMLTDGSGVSVTQISDRLDVSSVTVRSDMKSLVGKGLIVKTRGGAFPAFHQSILDRQKKMIKEKTRIAQAAAALISDGDHVMIDAGTTSAMIAKYLFGKHDIHIVTNSTLIFPYVRVIPTLRVTLIGGEFKPSTESTVGPITLRELEQFHVKYTFIGSDGFSIENGVTAKLVDGAEVVKKMAEQADERILLVDSTKYGNVGFAYILPLESMDRIITDKKLKKEDTAKLKDNGVEINVV